MPAEFGSSYERTVALDDHYVLRLQHTESGWSGQVCLPDGEGAKTGLQIFSVPAQSGEQEAEDWASRALRAYLEG